MKRAKLAFGEVQPVFSANELIFNKGLVIPARLQNAPLPAR